jgi:deoxyribodipyrimidine photo-lyase
VVSPRSAAAGGAVRQADHAPWTARPLDLQAAGANLGRDYPLPVVDHDEARARTLARFAVVKTVAA